MHIFMVYSLYKFTKIVVSQRYIRNIDGIWKIFNYQSSCDCNIRDLYTTRSHTIRPLRLRLQTLHGNPRAPSCSAGAANSRLSANPDSKVHGANMGPTWDRQDLGGPHVGSMKFAIWESYGILTLNPNQLVELNHRRSELSTLLPFQWTKLQFVCQTIPHS